MRLGIVSDIHCNIASLDVALERMGDVDEVRSAGDAGSQPRLLNDMIGRPHEVGARFVPGNGFPSSYATLGTQSGEVTFDVYDDSVHKPNDVRP